MEPGPLSAFRARDPAKAIQNMRQPKRSRLPARHHEAQGFRK
jgi:hypothetical protein